MLEAWYPGQEDGNAIASILFGDVDPGGKLPVSFPKSLAQVPAHTPEQWPGVDGNVQYSEKLQVGYRWYDAQHIAPLYPFGYGLSYTSFRLHDLTVGPTSISSRHPVTVTAYITNTGSRAGSETAQLYVGDPAALGEPPRQLHGFQKIFLRPGETRQVRFRLDPMEAFGYWNTAAHGTAVADGAYRIMVGDSSTHLPLHATVHVTRTFGPQTVVVDAPATIASGGSGMVTTTFTNDADLPVRQARVMLIAPNGWSTKALSPNGFPIVRPGQAVVTHWLVQVPADAVGTQTLTATARFTEQGRRGTASGSATVTVPYPSVAAAHNTVGVSLDSDPTAGTLDGGGYSFSAEALASVGVAPGKPVPNDNGAGFVWPDVPAGHPDAVTAAGQLITLTGSGSTLSVLGCGTFGTETAPVTLTYTDSSTSTGSLVLSDWYANAPDPGDQLVVTAPHWNIPPGSTLPPNHLVSLYMSSVPVTAGKTLASITLPSNANVHIFAVAVH